MKNYQEIIKQFVAAGLDAYPCEETSWSRVTFLADKQTKRLYVCSYVTDVIPSLLSIGPVLLNPENGQPRYAGSEYGIFVNEKTETGQAHFRSFIESVMADTEKTHKDDPAFPLYEAKEATKECVAQIARQLGYRVKNII